MREMQAASREHTTPGVFDQLYKRISVLPTEEQRRQHANNNYIMDAWYQTQQTPWPLPYDYNWMIRICNITPVFYLPSRDYDILPSCNVHDALVYALQVFALVRAATTTALYTFNLTGVCLHMYMARLPMSPTLNDITYNAMFQLEAAYRDANSGIFQLVFNLIEMCIGRHLEKLS